jgi:hypothetical protein
VTPQVLLVGRRALIAGAGALTIAALFAMFSIERDWVGSWKAALDTATGSLVIVGPVAAGWAALTYAGLHARRMPDFAASVIRGRRAWLSPLILIWLVGCFTVVGASAVATGLAQSLGSRAEPSQFWILGEAIAVLAAQVAIGALIGSIVVGPWAAPIATSAVFALGPLSVSGFVPGIFDTGSAAGSLVGNTWSVRVLALQSLTAMGLAVAVGCLLVKQVTPVRAWVSGGIAVAVATVTAIAWSVLDSGGYERYAYESSEPEWVCRGQSPQVCLSAETPRPLAAIATEMSRQAQALIDAGVRLPETFDQSVPGSRPRPGHGVIELPGTGELQTGVAAESIAGSLAMPAYCPAFYHQLSPIRGERAQVVLADWIGAQVQAGRGVMFGARERAWLASDRAGQEEWVRKTYDALAHCRLRTVTVPF